MTQTGAVSRTRIRTASRALGAGRQLVRAQWRRMGSPGNGAVNVETYELPFEAWRNDTYASRSSRRSITPAMPTRRRTAHAYHGGRFPTSARHRAAGGPLLGVQGDVPVEDFDYHGNVSDPKHSLAFLSLDTERIIHRREPPLIRSRRARRSRSPTT